jgi:hypothetical protein
VLRNNVTFCRVGQWRSLSKKVLRKNPSGTRENYPSRIPFEQIYPTKKSPVLHPKKIQFSVDILRIKFKIGIHQESPIFFVKGQNSFVFKIDVEHFCRARHSGFGHMSSHLHQPKRCYVLVAMRRSRFFPSFLPLVLTV